MDCRSVQRDLPALVDGDLRPHRAQVITKHLATCGDCAQSRKEYVAFRAAAKSALSYRGAPLSFESLRAEMHSTEPLEQVIRYQLPKLKIPGTVPRFAVAMALLVSIAGPSYACRHTRQVYVAVKTPFALQNTALTAVLDDGYLPGDSAYRADDDSSEFHA